MTQDQKLDMESGVVATAIDECLEEQTEGRVEEAQEQGQSSWQVVSNPATVACLVAPAIS